MAMDFIVPSVQIDESDVGPRPTPQISLSGIGIVGTFERGPINTPITIGDVSQLVTQFGGYVKGLTGYLSAYAALNQGANDLRIVRIAGKGAACAELTLQGLAIKAKSGGVWGNEIKVTVKAGEETFDLTIQFRAGAERFTELTLDTLDQITSDYVTVVKTSEAKPETTTVPSNLTGGTDGAATVAADYLGAIDNATGKRSGLKLLETTQLGIVLCAQQHGEQIWSGLNTFVENCDVEEGLRVAILNSAPQLSMDSAVPQTVTFDTARAIFTYPWLEPEDLPGQYVAPDGYYAGVLSVLNPHQSPSNKQIKGILSTQGDFVYAQVKGLTQAKISPITLVRNRGFRIRSGINLASDSAWSQTNIRRQQDKMEMELYDAMQWAVSEPHAEPLWNAIADQVDMYLQVQKNLGFIRGYNKTLCNAQTNPPENIPNRILTCVIRWLPLYAADFVILKFKRELKQEEMV